MNSDREKLAKDIIKEYQAKRFQNMSDELKKRYLQLYDDLKQYFLVNPEQLNDCFEDFREGKKGEIVSAFIPGYSLSREEPEDLKIIEELEERGFKVIYPEELTKSYLNGLNKREKESYKIKRIKPLIVDTMGEKSLRLADIIARYFFQGELKESYNKGENRKNYEVNEDIYRAGATESLEEILKEVGFNDVKVESFNHTADEPNNVLSVKSDIPYQNVDESKFKTIYEGAKGKLESIMKLIKSLKLLKEEKENNTKDLLGDDDERN